mgnify:CR=1 FL=1
MHAACKGDYAAPYLLHARKCHRLNKTCNTRPAQAGCYPESADLTEDLIWPIRSDQIRSDQIRSDQIRSHQIFQYVFRQQSVRYSAQLSSAQRHNLLHLAALQTRAGMASLLRSKWCKTPGKMDTSIIIMTPCMAWGQQTCNVKHPSPPPPPPAAGAAAAAAAQGIENFIQLLLMKQQQQQRGSINTPHRKPPPLHKHVRALHLPQGPNNDKQSS